MDSPPRSVWNGVYERFADAPACGRGLEGEIWARSTQARLGSILSSPDDGNDPAATLVQHGYLLPVVAAMLTAARSRLAILDFGGGPGFSYPPVARALVRFEGLKFHVVDSNPEVCELGRRAFADDSRITFHTGLSTVEGPLDLAHFGSSLHYVDDWLELLRNVAARRPAGLLLSDVPAGPIPTFVTLQDYYGSRIPVRFWNRDDLVGAIEALGFRLTFEAPFYTRILGQGGALPMTGLPETHRLKHMRHFLFLAA